MLRLISYIRGYLTVSVSGTFCERFLNVCAAKGILLWNIVRISDRSLRCCLSVAAFRKLPPISYRTGVRVHILCRHGLPFVIKQYKKRKALVFGACFAMAIFVIANQFVWDIEIRGNETVHTKDILEALSEEGLYIGARKSRIDQQTLKNRMLIKMPSLAWLWADKQGSKVIVDVRERIPVPALYDAGDYCNVVAKKDGVVHSMIVKNGVPTVKEGDTVLKGTVLVTGKIPSELKPEIRYVRAEAQVFARVWYEKTERFSRLSEERTETGKQKRRVHITAFGKTFPQKTKEPPFAECDVETKRHKLSFFGKETGIVVETAVYREVEVSGKRHTAETVAAEGVKALKKQMDAECSPTAELIAVSDGFREVDEETVEVTVRAEYLEDIAVQVR